MLKIQGEKQRNRRKDEMNEINKTDEMNEINEKILDFGDKFIRI